MLVVLLRRAVLKNKNSNLPEEEELVGVLAHPLSYSRTLSYSRRMAANRSSILPQ